MERKTLWNGIGIDVTDCTTSEQVMQKAGLDFTVSKNPLPWNETETPFYTITNDRTNQLLGIVRKNYIPIQNTEAFDFIDELIPEGVNYEKVGVSKDGTKIWVLAKLPETKILDDNFEPYMVFINSMDGQTSAKACMTPVRVACQNTLNLAFKRASRKWTFRHCKTAPAKLAEAKMTFISANNYMENLKIEMEALAQIPVSQQKFQYVAQTLFPEKQTSREYINQKQYELREQLKTTFKSDDLGNLQGTALGLLNAVSDITMHREMKKGTDEFSYGARMMKIAEYGEPLLDKAFQLLVK